LFEKKENRLSPTIESAPVSRGIKLAVVGDAGRTDNLIEIVRDADALVIESTYLDEEVDMARRFSHLTAKDAAELAVRAGVKRLILPAHLPSSSRQGRAGRGAHYLSQYGVARDTTPSNSKSKIV
jgi:ribonuclease Z